MKKAEVQMTFFKKVKPNVFDKIIEKEENDGHIKLGMYGKVKF